MKHDPDCWCHRHCIHCGREATIIDSRGARMVMLCADHAEIADTPPSAEPSEG